MRFSKMFSKENVLSFLYISIILALGRLIPHPPNFTPILAAAIFAPYIINNKWVSIAVPLVAMLIADLFIGFHPYILWVYGAIALSTLFSFALKNLGRMYIQLGMMTVFSSLIFFAITNFSVWLVWDYYPKNFEGLISCYTLAIPFFKNTLISTCLFTIIFTLNHNQSKIGKSRLLRKK